MFLGQLTNQATFETRLKIAEPILVLLDFASGRANVVVFDFAFHAIPSVNFVYVWLSCLGVTSFNFVTPCRNEDSSLVLTASKMATVARAAVLSLLFKVRLANSAVSWLTQMPPLTGVASQQIQLEMRIKNHKKRSVTTAVVPIASTPNVTTIFTISVLKVGCHL